jgi:hypothetical protein
MHGSAGGVLVATHGLYGATSLRTLLLSEAHIFWLHHVGGHAQRLLMATVCSTGRANGLYFGLLHSHHVKRLFRWNGIENIVIGRFLSTKIGIVIVQCI